MPESSLATAAARDIHEAFAGYHDAFQAVSRRSRARFEARDWRGAREDARARLALYGAALDRLVARLQERLEANARNAFLWHEVRSVHARLVAGRKDAELERTFFNSVTRRVFVTVGVDPHIEYLDEAIEGRGAADEAGYWTYRGGRPTREILTDLLSGLPLRPEFEDLTRDAGLAAAAIDREAGAPVDAIEVLPPLFYRGKGAYLVGRIRRGPRVAPLLLAFLHEDAGILVDAALTTEDEVSIVFSFTRAYFHVEADRPRAIVAFLRSILPRKPVAELYTSLGYHKHGKSLLYRSIMRHLASTEARFEVAEGEAGLVMTVFALPSMNLVFKIIRDRFGHPKTTTREQVRAKYQLVFIHDRVGRLADAQEFEHLEFDRARFDPALLADLLAEAGQSVRLEGERVVIAHAYTERQVTPLNLYLRQASPDAARDAILDYGNAIKELAAANIFTGDMLLKNFGVTRHGRVIFYDYDELCLLTDCNFRRIPETDDPLEEMAAEPWFSVGEGDVFPEEFRAFFVLPGALGEAFLARHADLLTVEYWQGMQARQAAGDLVDFFPYRPERRLRAGAAAGAVGP